YTKGLFHRRSNGLTTYSLSFREIAKKAKVLVSTVSYTINKHLETGKNSGRPEAIRESQDKFLKVNSLCDGQLTGQQLQAQLNTAAGLTSQVAVRKLAWAMEHCHWTTEDWKKVLWTDESKFEMFGSSRRVFVCCSTIRIQSFLECLSLLSVSDDKYSSLNSPYGNEEIQHTIQ
uniref:Transposase Tc1-like domain-containing protein n=1 Tax=Scleropages formosus TaxID=113540 RepID=A0A8C9VFS6_SCLFO